MRILEMSVTPMDGCSVYLLIHKKGLRISPDVHGNENPSVVKFMDVPEEQFNIQPSEDPKRTPQEKLWSFHIFASLFFHREFPVQQRQFFVETCPTMDHLRRPSKSLPGLYRLTALSLP